MKYPIKWGIIYRKRTYIEVYGKKKAHELLYSLSSCVLGLSVAPVESKGKPEQSNRENSREYYKRWLAKNREKVRTYQREYRSKKREK